MGKIDERRYKSRFDITNQPQHFMFTYHDEKLLVDDSIDRYGKYYDTINRLLDDLELIPRVKQTLINKSIPKFYKFGYDKGLYDLSELLSFLYASINENWDIIIGKERSTGKKHYYLMTGDIIYDPSLEIIASSEHYSRYYENVKVIKNRDIQQYLKDNDNLDKFYNSKRKIRFLPHPKTDFSSMFIENFINDFNQNVNEQFGKKDIETIKKESQHDDFFTMRQYFVKKRKWEIQSDRIHVHENINPEILEEIEKNASVISKKWNEKYGDIHRKIDYHTGTLGNCYALSILFNLYDSKYKLVQGGIRFQNSSFYQHSWLQKDDIVYDPALRIVLPANLYYQIVERQDTYTQEDTKAILRRIGFDLCHFRDFFDGKQIGNDERIQTRIRQIDTPEDYKSGTELINTISEDERE